MITIQLINGIPAESIPEGTIAIINNGTELKCYLPGDQLPDVLLQAEQPQPIAPQWDEFYQSQEVLLFDLINAATNIVAATALMIEFGKRSTLAGINTSNLIKYWNLSVALNIDEQSIATLNDAAQQYSLPVSIAATGEMV